MPVVNEVLSIEQALNRQLPVWDVIIKGSTGAPNPFTVYPDVGLPALPSAFALAIGPRSTFDRCWVEWDPQVKVSITGAEAQTKDFIRRLSIESPLLFQQLGNRKLGQPGDTIDPISAIRVGVAPFVFGITNNDDLDDIILLQSFLPTAIGSVVPTEPIFVSTANDLASPQLHLVLYLAESLPPPTKRFPIRYRIENVSIPISSPVTTQYIRTVPVMGRKHIRFEFWTDPSIGTAVYTATVAGVNPHNGGAGPDAFDVSLGSVAAVSATAPKTITLDNPLYDYINIYALPTGGTPDGMTVIITAYD